MVKILFITEKYHTAEIKEITNNRYNLIGSWECAGYGDYEWLHIDEHEGIWSSQEMDAALLSRDFDCCVISMYHHLPSINVLQRFGHKTCILWWDAIVSLGGIFHWSNYAHQIIFDHGFGEEYPNVYSLSVPQDHKVFYPDANIEKNIDISFCGSIDAPRPDRKIILDKLKNAGFNVVGCGGRGIGLGRENLPIEEYANIMHKSKICLNLMTGHSQMQRKGRTFELAATKSFMMANNCQMFSGKNGKMFDNEIDYSSFDDNNLIDRAAYFLEHADERQQMTERFYQKYLNNYAPKHFWKKILTICGVAI